MRPPQYLQGCLEGHEPLGYICPSLPPPPPHRPTHPPTTPHHTTPHHTTPHHTTPHHTTPHHTTPHHTTPHHTTPHHTTPHPPPHHTTPHRTAPHRTAPHRTTFSVGASGWHTEAPTLYHYFYHAFHPWSLPRVGTGGGKKQFITPNVGKRSGLPERHVQVLFLITIRVLGTQRRGDGNSVRDTLQRPTHQNTWTPDKRQLLHRPHTLCRQNGAQRNRTLVPYSTLHDMT